MIQPMKILGVPVHPMTMQGAVDELEKRTGRKVIGNIAASGTEIIKDLGEEHMKTGSI